MYQGQIGLKVKIPQSGLVLEHIVYQFTLKWINKMRVVVGLTPKKYSCN